MDKKEYLAKKQDELKSIIFENKTLDNFNRQLFAKKIGEPFKESFKEDYLWRYALYLSSTGAFLLEEYPENDIGLDACRIAAEIYENIYHVSKSYDKKYSLILSSLCYDISGYQANAQCLINELTSSDEYYQLNNETDEDHIIIYENFVFKTIQLFLQKKIPGLLDEVNSFNFENLVYLSPNYQNAFKYYNKSITKLCNFILHHETGDFFDDLKRSHLSFINSGNVELSHLTSLLQTRIKLFHERNTWNVLDRQGKLPDRIWDIYLKLLSMDLYQSNRIKPENERNSIFEFWKSQLNAINNGILSNNENYVIQMPTSAGKTLIAEIMIIDSLIKTPNSKCIYVAPFRALTSEIEENLGERLGKLGFNVSSAAGAYELDEFQEIWINDVDVLVATPEKVDLIFRLHKNYFDNVSLVVIDEGHVIGDISNRSSLLEFLIIKLRKNLKGIARFLFISAVMSKMNAQEFSIWLSGKETNLISSPEINGKEWEPTRKLMGFFQWYDRKHSGQIIFPNKGINKKEPAFLPNIIKTERYEYKNVETNRINTRKFPKPDKKNETSVELAYKFIEDGPVLIFSSQPRWAKSIGESFLDLISLKTKVNEEITPLLSYKTNLESIRLAKEWLGDDHILTKCLQRGIGIHYSSLPDSVKKAVETDFRKRELSVLISTNTVGQGVNFPIKTIIVQSLAIGENDKIKIKDFWNILGRAGRAGKETEGRIIFIVLKDHDLELYYEYTNKSNIEASKSLLFLILSTLIEARISESNLELLDEILEEYIEPYLLDLLLEEAVDTSDEVFVKEMLGYSLFMIQSDNKDYNIQPIVNSIVNIKQRFYLLDKDLRQVYAKTGIKISSCNKILEYIEEHILELKEIIINDDYESLLEKVINILFKIPEMNEDRTKLNNDILKDNKEELSFFVSEWVNGSSIIELNVLWRIFFSDSPLKDEMHEYINKVLEYRYPWGFTIFLLILIYSLNKHFLDMPKKYDDLPENIRNLSSYIKYGLNVPSACIAKSIGINTRETSLKIANYFGNVEIKEFIEIFKNLDDEDMEKLNLSRFEQNNVIYLIQKLNFGTITIDELKTLEFNVKGIYYSDERRQLASQIKIGDILELERDFLNSYDVYAIKLMQNDLELGYVPRSIAKILAVEMDLNERPFLAKIIKIENEYQIKFRIMG